MVLLQDVYLAISLVFCFASVTFLITPVVLLYMLL
uniref:Uncharacterized protein n=1 Tax=Arundo donax TaxID=35708 RepID=A0A0A8ZUL0_ARUDO